jgi:hypothetical protein
MSTALDEDRARAGSGRPVHLSLLRTPALREAWSALWRSRLLIWLVACVAVLTVGVNATNRASFDIAHLSNSLGDVGNVLAAPAMRWDAIWYVWISEHGYNVLQTTGFFPLYPLLVHVGSWIAGGSAVLAGIALSLVAALAGLAVVHRLAELEFGDLGSASATVKLMAFAPFAFYLSAVYTEALFLALSAGTFLAARRGRWALAGALGGLAAMTRVTGLLLLVPVVMVFLYGPRGDVAAPEGHGRWRPDYPFSPSLLWALLIPAGGAVFGAYTAARGFGFFASFHAQHLFWQHRFSGPLVAAWDGLKAAWLQIKAVLTGHLTASTRAPSVLQVIVLLVSCLGLAGVARRLPPVYAVYVGLGLLVPLWSPTVGDPLRGLDRYASMMFPLFMWLGAWGRERQLESPLVMLSAVLLAGFTVQFATWHLVGSIPT